MQFRPSPICDAEQLYVAGGAFITGCWKRKLRLNEFKFFFFFFFPRLQSHKATALAEVVYFYFFSSPYTQRSSFVLLSPKRLLPQGDPHNLHSFYPWSGLWKACHFAGRLARLWIFF